jgi:hypothetical protein
LFSLGGFGAFVCKRCVFPVRRSSHDASRQRIPFSASVSLQRSRFYSAASRGFGSAAPLLILYAPHRFFLLALFPEFWLDALRAVYAP